MTAQLGRLRVICSSSMCRLQSKGSVGPLLGFGSGSPVARQTILSLFSNGGAAADADGDAFQQRSGADGRAFGAPSKLYSSLAPYAAGSQCRRHNAVFGKSHIWFWAEARGRGRWNRRLIGVPVRFGQIAPDGVERRFAIFPRTMAGSEPAAILWQPLQTPLSSGRIAQNRIPAMVAGSCCASYVSNLRHVTRFPSEKTVSRASSLSCH